MKSLLLLFCFAFSVVAKAQIGFTQKSDTLDFYREIQAQDMAELILLSNKSIGFLGDDYQRFYIHFTSVKKDEKNPYQYLVKGKTKVKENICTFTGIVTIKTAITFKVDDDEEIPQDIREGKFTASVAIQEDKNQYGSGEIKGILTKGFILKSGKMIDDDPLYYGDMPYEGNYFEGNWKSYKTGKSKTCMWHNGGGWKMKQDLFHLGDDGDVYINPKYKKNGW
ncbi:MAG TPA: hypothetical protein PKX92_04630 [Edaphocola sp.]|nr:hypothetical protein [Edaphocola sp.]